MAQFMLKIGSSYIWGFLFNSALRHPRKYTGTLCLGSIYCAYLESIPSPQDLPLASAHLNFQ